MQHAAAVGRIYTELGVWTGLGAVMPVAAQWAREVYSLSYILQGRPEQTRYYCEFSRQSLKCSNTAITGLTSGLNTPPTPSLGTITTPGQYKLQGGIQLSYQTFNSSEISWLG